MRRALPLLLTLLFSMATLAQHTSEIQSCAQDGIAVGGYDLVSYHQDSGPVAGDPAISHEYQQLTYLFSNQENLRTFIADPETYLPTYQGWCAATLAMGRLACPDYTNFKIEKGRLLLFELAGFTNGRALWDADPSGFRQRADKNFKALVQ